VNLVLQVRSRADAEVTLYEMGELSRMSRICLMFSRAWTALGWWVLWISARERRISSQI